MPTHTRQKRKQEVTDFKEGLDSRMVLKKTAGKEQNVLVMNIKLHGKVISHTLDLYKGDLERSSKEVVKCTIEDFVTKHSPS